ncbi:ornithine uptake porin CarO [Acinetobacter equi]|uniref:Uncharacterized protein n=1 Tax=Acinetobacter equi TaxID=1324350 RepID=A0A0N9WG90_9GAMM|nr:ornithine uptake porin CarO [Acinetobacter equi]ALH96516.1 hypothetical protein AOY20_13715 [Acinetobacter equi]
MKMIRVILATSALVTMTSTSIAGVINDGSSDSSLMPTGVRAEVGTTGYGGAIQWTANPYIGITLGYNGGKISWSNDLKVDGSTYDLETKSKTTYLNAEIYPWGTSENKWAQAAYVVAGVAYLDNKYDIEREVGSGRDFSVNNKSFTASGQVNIDGKLNYNNSFAPYVGLGYAPKINKNWGVFGEIGAYYTRNPDVTLTATGNVAGGRDDEFKEAVRQEARNIANKTKYEWLPVGKVGVNLYW